MTTETRILQELSDLKREAVKARLYSIATILRDAEVKITEDIQPLCQPCKPESKKWYGLRSFIFRFYD